MTDIAKSCVTCRHFKNSGIFELCTSPHSEYFYDGKPDYHTATHMKDERRGRCGPSLILWAPRDA